MFTVLTTIVVSYPSVTSDVNGFYEFTELEKIGKLCKDKNLAFHIDGARLFNALVAKKESPLQYGKLFDSISICLSKGLGAPVGSVLLGNTAFVKKARRWRKVFGGGMRQAGSLAAAGIYALDHHVDRLKQDHEKALLIKAALVKKDFVTEVFEVETNIVIAKIEGKYNATQLSALLKEHHILVIAMTPALVRFVLHLDITDEMLTTTIATIEKL